MAGDRKNWGRPLRSVFLATLGMLLLAGAAWASPESGESGGSSAASALLVRAMVFAVFAGLLVYLLRKPVSKFFSDRRENIAHTLEYLETQEKNLNEQVEILNKKMDDLAAEREAVMAKFEEEGCRERDRLIAEAQATAERIKEQAGLTLALEITQAKAALKAQVAETAARLAEELVKKSVTAEDQERLARDFLAQVTRLAESSGSNKTN